MEVNHLRNGNGDVLDPIRTSERFALYQVIDSEKLRHKDIYFIIPLEPKVDIYGTKLHMAGGNDWEKAGNYIEGSKKALTVFDDLNGNNKDEYYKSKTSQV
jgi:hypothetical protein